TLAGDEHPWQSELAWVQPPETDLHTLALAEADAPHDALRSAHDRVLASGRAEVLDRLDVPFPPGADGGPPLRAAAVLPLRARGRTLGVLVLGCGDGRPAPDLALAEDLAGRAAIALDN